MSSADEIMAAALKATEAALERAPVYDDAPAAEQLSERIRSWFDGVELRTYTTIQLRAGQLALRLCARDIELELTQRRFEKPIAPTQGRRGEDMGPSQLGRSPTYGT